MKAEGAHVVGTAAAETEPRDGGGDRAEGELPAGITSILDVDASTASSARGVPATAMPQLGLAFVLDVRGAEVDLRVGAASVVGEVSPVVHASVLRTAMERGEPVLVERAPSGALTVVGALRTQPTPGVDAMEEIELEADRIHLRGRKEITLSTSGVAQMALRAAGEIETYASRIVSRAEELHKIVGRMLRLN